MSEARDSILGSIRAGLRGVKVPEAPDRTLPVGRPTVDAPVATFTAAIEALGGTVTSVADEAAAARHLCELAQERGWKEIALSDSPLVTSTAEALEGVTSFDGTNCERARLFACDAGISTVQGAVAETGTLVLLAASERHRLVSLVPPLHVALLRTSQLAPTLDSALALAQQDGQVQGHLVTLISGPSRTADIELTLVVGVHGPSHLHIVLIVDEPSP